VTTLRRNKLDLHTHTRRSDGVLEPRALYDQMRGYGMRLVSITDHDSLEGLRDITAAGLGAESGPAGPQVLAGVEINTVGDAVYAGLGLGRDGAEVHILGYGMRLADAAFAATLDRQRQGRRIRLELTLERLRALGMPVDEQLLALAPEASDALGRPHVARALVAAGYADSVDDAFARWLEHGRPAHIRRQGLGPREAIEAIAAAGGLPVLAHSPLAVEHADVITELQGWGLRGLEVYYRTFEPARVARLATFAAERGLLASGGSDYHGDSMSYAQQQASTYVPDGVGERLLEALAA
jgi:predicted metal-dependent phosphoesterase TrpH